MFLTPPYGKRVRSTPASQGRPARHRRPGHLQSCRGAPDGLFGCARGRRRRPGVHVGEEWGAPRAHSPRSLRRLNSRGKGHTNFGSGQDSKSQHCMFWCCSYDVDRPRQIAMPDKFFPVAVITRGSYQHGSGKQLTYRDEHCPSSPSISPVPVPPSGPSPSQLKGTTPSTQSLRWKWHRCKELRQARSRCAGSGTGATRAAQDGQEGTEAAGTRP